MDLTAKPLTWAEAIEHSNRMLDAMEAATSGRWKIDPVESGVHRPPGGWTARVFDSTRRVQIDWNPVLYGRRFRAFVYMRGLDSMMYGDTAIDAYRSARLKARSEAERLLASVAELPKVTAGDW